MQNSYTTFTVFLLLKQYWMLIDFYTSTLKALDLDQYLLLIS